LKWFSVTRRQSVLEYETRINRVIDYIADNLTDSLPLRKLARIACFSEFHFHRIFAGTTGETVAEFVTRMRLERALQLLHADRNRKLTDVALEAGFKTPSDFSRVFRKRYGVSASRFDFAAFWKDRKIGKDDSRVSSYFWKEFPSSIRFPVRVKQIET
jgi:AraC family transcriptional regulator